MDSPHCCRLLTELSHTRYGFNPGSELMINAWSANLGMEMNGANQITSRVAVTTTICAASGGVSALFFGYALHRQWNLLDVCNGVLCGLVT